MAYSDPVKQKEFQRYWQREQRVKRRTRLIELLGGKCIDCGITDERVLQVDHVEPLLRASADRGKTTGVNLARKVLAKKVSSDGLELRCANCHQIKTYEDRKKFKNYIN